MLFLEIKETDKEKNKHEEIGAFYFLPQYMKLYQYLCGGYSNYKVTVTWFFYIMMQWCFSENVTMHLCAFRLLQACVRMTNSVHFFAQRWR